MKSTKVISGRLEATLAYVEILDEVKATIVQVKALERILTQYDREDHEIAQPAGTYTIPT